MTSPTQSAFRSTRLGAVLASLLVCMVVGFGLLAARPDWHAAFHSLSHSVHAPEGGGDHHHGHDSDGSQGHGDAGCVIQLFANGLIDSVDVEICFESSIVWEVATPRFGVEWESSHLGLSPPGRAPPFIS